MGAWWLLYHDGGEVILLDLRIATQLTDDGDPASWDVATNAILDEATDLCRALMVAFLQACAVKFWIDGGSILRR